jgi:tetratricopeptide (TPR) repeat protein
MSLPSEEPNPFKNPFTDVQAPSAWEAIKERTKQERQPRRQALVAVLLEFAGVALAASAAASIGMDDGALFSALKYASLGGLCGGGFCVAFAMFAVTGAHRALLPAYYLAAYSATMQHVRTPRGVPVIFPLALVGAVAGIFLFTTLGAVLGAEVPGGDSSNATATLLRAFLGGIAGLLPVGLWWMYVRQRAGKGILVVIGVLVACFSFTCMAGFIGFLTGAVQPTKLDYDALLNRGYNRYDRGDLDGAIADYSKAIKINPKSEDAFYNRGLARDNQGDLQGAIADYSKAIEIDPTSDRSYQNRGYSRWKKGDLQGAIADSSKAVELNPKEAGAYGIRGVALLEQGKDAEAQKDFEQCLKLDPSLKRDLDRDIQKAKQRRQQKR